MAKDPIDKIIEQTTKDLAKSKEILIEAKKLNEELFRKVEESNKRFKRQMESVKKLLKEHLDKR